MEKVMLAEFSEELQVLVNQVEQTGNTLEIIRDGETVAIISPAISKKRYKFGAMKHRTQVTGDIVEPSSSLAN
jgi:antitoxin (DNA-binding transcriptional repressor) of toxin-antitoxin stability system